MGMVQKCTSAAPPGPPLFHPMSRCVSSSGLLFNNCRKKGERGGNMGMDEDKLDWGGERGRGHASFRLCNVSGHKTELLEIHAHRPWLHVLFIPGNPGVVTFYKDFANSLYHLLGGRASVTVVGHISHSQKEKEDKGWAWLPAGRKEVGLQIPAKKKGWAAGRAWTRAHYSQIEKDWEGGKLFSLQEQIDHKVSFIRNELQNTQVPIVLVGHSIGSYICVEILKSVKKISYFIGLYPFLRLNTQSLKQAQIGKIAGSSILSVALSFIVASLGLLPSWASRFVVEKSVGTSWSNTAVEATCTHLLQYHMMRNLLFLAMTEFRKLSEAPDWNFMRENASHIAFLFGVDDHWGPLAMFEEISKQAPGIALSVEREGHTHSFCCTEAGSLWVARHVATLISDKEPDISIIQ